MDNQTAKQQIVDTIKNASSILVTTNQNPSVDEVVSAVGLTKMLQSMNKHATAVISSTVPSALSFLNPDENIEKTTDKLRDYVISFDKEKADKLRYKVEDDQVKVFITPYKTVITQDDFTFSQGDFNVNVIVVLGATKRDELDEAVLKNGRVLHEANVVTINAGKDKQATVGNINWTDTEASSITEMLVSMSEALGSGLLKDDSARAFLTGLISATNKFTNDQTTPKIMTMAAQLMAAGANQQEIMEKLAIGEKHETKVVEPPVNQAQSIGESAEQEESTKKDDDVMLDLSKQHTEKSDDNPVIQLESEIKEETKPVDKPEQKPEEVVPATVKNDGASIEDKVEQKLREAAESAAASNTLVVKPQTEQKSLTKPGTQDAQSNQEPKSELQGHRLLGSNGADSTQSGLLDHPSNDDEATNDHEALGSHSVNDIASSTEGLFEHAKKTEAPKTDTPHIKLNPEIPTLKPQSSIEQKSNLSETPQAGKESKLEAKPAEEQTKPKGLDDARKAVEAALAESGSPLPSPKQASGTTEVNTQDSNEITIDHDGNLKTPASQ